MISTTNTTIPEGFTKAKIDVTLDKAYEILGYCHACLNQPDCPMNRDLRGAMAENYPYWSTKFISVTAPSPRRPDGTSTHTFCVDYIDPQMKLPNIPMPFSDGVERMVETFAQERKKLERGFTPGDI